MRVEDLLLWFSVMDFSSSVLFLLKMPFKHIQPVTYVSNAGCFLFKYLLNVLSLKFEEEKCYHVSLVVMILCVHNLILGSDSVTIDLVSSFLHLLFVCFVFFSQLHQENFACEDLVWCYN